MPKSSLDELRVQIAAGEYAVDSRALAGDILSKFDVVRRVGHWLMDADEEDAAGELRDLQARGRRGSRRESSRRQASPRERLP